MNEMDALWERYDATVREWRCLRIDSRKALAAALAEYRIYFAYNSGRIENPAISYTGDVRTLFEIQNQKECHELLLDAFAQQRSIDEALVLEVHRTLTQGTYDERRWERGERPGMYKLHEYVVGASEAGSPPQAVAGDIESLVEELSAATPANVLTVASYFHAVFESIHPFADGNGRVGRALSNYLLVTNQHPPIIVYDKDKLAYYGALQVFDGEGDLSPMIDFLCAETVKTWLKGF